MKLKREEEYNRNTWGLAYQKTRAGFSLFILKEWNNKLKFADSMISFYSVLQISMHKVSYSWYEMIKRKL